MRVDKDGSGAITPNEVEDLLTETYGFPPLEEEVKMFMEEFDLNNDGKVTLEEFTAHPPKKGDKKPDKTKPAVPQPDAPKSDAPKKEA